MSYHIEPIESGYMIGLSNEVKRQARARGFITVCLFVGLFVYGV